MSLSIFAVKNQYYKNGIWWFTKVLNRVAGEENWENIRITRRILGNKLYYLRRQWMYRVFIDSPDLAQMWGIYPLIDNSHGYGSNTSYEMYRDFQENTLNSDGSFAMWVYFFCGLYFLHELYTYITPWYWFKTAPCKNGEESRHRMRDALNSTIVQETTTMQFMQWGFGPHSAFILKQKLSEGHMHPDDVRAMHVSSLSRFNRYKEHYKKMVDDRKRMIAF